MKSLIASAHSLKLERIACFAGAITVTLSTRSLTTSCPQCHQPALKIHSRYERTLADLPWEGIAVKLQIRARKFFCRNAACPQRIFCERLPELANPYARRTLRLNEVLTVIGFALGGRPGAGVTEKLSLAASARTLLRRVRATSAPAVSSVRVLGVDDFAFRKGQHYGTILVDQEQRRVVDLLPDREAATLEQWLRAHPGVEIITRDRAGAYADGARRGVPQAQQVADRWHLCRNVTETFERVIHSQHKSVREAVEQLPPLKTSPPAAAEEVPRVVPDTPSEYMRTRAERERRQRLHAVGKAHYEQVRDLRQQGYTIVEIRKHLGWSYGRVARFYHAEEYPAIRRGKGKSCLDRLILICANAGQPVATMPGNCAGNCVPEAIAAVGSPSADMCSSGERKHGRHCHQPLCIPQCRRRAPVSGCCSKTKRS